MCDYFANSGVKVFRKDYNFKTIVLTILFTADLHFGHTNILKHQPNRPFAQEYLFLIQGNHDGSIRAYSNYFKTTAQILDLTVKPTACPFLPENLQLTLCHYPMVTWNHKPHGSIMLHGHCHGKLDEHNRLSNDLRFDVGIDGELAKRAGGFIPLELIYEVAMEKTGGVPFHQYAKQNYRSEVR